MNPPKPGKRFQQAAERYYELNLPANNQEFMLLNLVTMKRLNAVQSC
jgi:hypothetical protein